MRLWYDLLLFNNSGLVKKFETVFYGLLLVLQRAFWVSDTSAYK